MKQPGKEIADEKRIGENQCPTDDSFEVDLNFSSLSRRLNPENFLTNHLSLPRQFCKQSANL
jgi:hypothetical protein